MAKSEKHPLSSQLLSYCDDFAEFNERCAFLCDAFSAIAAQNECMDETTASGLYLHATWLKERTSELHDEIVGILDELA